MQCVALYDYLDSRQTQFHRAGFKAISIGTCTSLFLDEHPRDARGKALHGWEKINTALTSKMTPVSRDTSSTFADGVDELVRGWKRPSAIWNERKHIHQISVCSIGQQKLKGKQHLELISENIFSFFSRSTNRTIRSMKSWDWWMSWSESTHPGYKSIINQQWGAEKKKSFKI